MQSVNDDMDALIRKAGVEYPLYTGGADWSKVSSALENKVRPPAPKKNYGKYLGLFLIFLVSWLFTQFDYDKGNAEKKLTANSHLANDEKITALHTSSFLNQENEEITPDKNETTAVSINHDLPPMADMIYTPAKKRELAENKRKQVIDPKMELALTENNPQGPETNATQNKHFKTEKQEVLTELRKQKAEVTGITFLSFTSENHNEPINRFSPNGTEVETIALLDSPITKIAVASNPVISTGPRKKFYIGIVGGLNATSIKMQEVKKVGADFGLIAGYRFMKRWSFEAGVISSSKYYYSDGEYLNNSKIYLPPNSKIKTVEGDCRMIEIPMVIKYDFGFKKGHSWFTSAGVSSFLMKKEDYVYDYYYINTGTSYLYKKTYENESENWAAVMQLSAGYSRGIPLNLNLRIEPFIQIPLKGAGYGKLPLTSAGLRVGITRSLF